jgi:disulfide bond formation protein DsbB
MRARKGSDDEKPDLDWILLFAAWMVAFVATAGSLFFSYVMEFVPCVLCWYQRIFLFPLVFVLARGLFPFDRSAAKYGVPLATAGWIVAGYHNLVQAGIVPESLQPCAKGVSCNEEYLNLLGLLSIPALSLLAFTTVAGILIALNRRGPR